MRVAAIYCFELSLYDPTIKSCFCNLPRTTCLTDTNQGLHPSIIVMSRQLGCHQHVPTLWGKWQCLPSLTIYTYIYNGKVCKLTGHLLHWFRIKPHLNWHCHWLLRSLNSMAVDQWFSWDSSLSVAQPLLVSPLVVVDWQIATCWLVKCTHFLSRVQTRIAN